MQAILIPMIRKNDNDVLNVCNPGIITSVFDLLVSLPSLVASSCYIIHILKLCCHLNGLKDG